MLASRHVVLRGYAKWLLVAGVFSYSSWSLALGLGDITIHSALNQPLKADIALVDVGGLSESELSVSLATPDEFGRAGVERVFFLNDLKFIPILRGNRQLIRVTSSKPVNEPFLNFLVQLNQPNGRLLREYTVLIDPPGSPGIVPAPDELDLRPQSSAFPTVEPATPTTAAQGKRNSAPAAPAPPPIAAPASDALAEQLAASVWANQQMQKTIDELNAKLQEQQTLIADGKKQLGDLQARLVEVQTTAPAPVVTPPVPAPVLSPVEAPDEGLNWPLLGGLLVLLGLLATGFLVRRQRQQRQAETPLPVLPLANELAVDESESTHASSSSAAVMQRDEPTNGDVLEAVGIYLAYGRLGEALGLLRDALHKEPERIDLGLQLLEVFGRQGANGAYDEQENHLRNFGVDDQQLQDIRARHPKLATVAPVLPIMPAAAVAATAVQPPSEADFELNLDQLSMDSSWDLEDSKPDTVESTADVSALGSSLEVLPVDFELPEASASESAEEPELEWIADADTQTLDDDFLNEFGDPGPSSGSDPLDAANAGKLEQAQTCIDDGDIDSAIALLNELLKDGDEPLRQTARTLLAGIR